MLVINFSYGLMVFGVCIINYFFIKNEVPIVKFLLTLIFALDFSILYLIIIYKLNFGMFNYYYLLAFTAGFYSGYIIKKHVNMTTIVKRIIDFIRSK